MPNRVCYCCLLVCLINHLLVMSLHSSDKFFLIISFYSRLFKILILRYFLYVFIELRMSLYHFLAFLLLLLWLGLQIRLYWWIIWYHAFYGCRRLVEVELIFVLGRNGRLGVLESIRRRYVILDMRYRVFRYYGLVLLHRTFKQFLVQKVGCWDILLLFLHTFI